MSKIYESPILINQDYLKSFSPIPLNYNWEEIRPFIKIAESIHIEPILGSKLYKELLKEVKNNNITQENSTLLLHIYQFEAIAVCSEALPFLTYQVTQKGITKSKSDNTESIDNQEFSQIKNDLASKIEVLKRMLVQFLEDNKTCYPLYSSKIDKHTTPDVRIYGSNQL